MKAKCFQPRVKNLMGESTCTALTKGFSGLSAASLFDIVWNRDGTPRVSFRYAFASASG